MKSIPGTDIVRRVPLGKRSPSNVEGSPHVPLPFEQRYRKALSDAQLQRNLLNFQRSWRESREVAWATYDDNPLTPKPEGERAPTANPHVHIPHRHGSDDFEALRDRLAAIKNDIIERLPEYVDQFQRAAEANGVRVYRAASADEANRYVLELCERHGIKHVVKSKTMVSEEINLNAVLEEHGIEAVETDLGEWIVQLAHERPSHMVMPAIHKSRQQVGELFTDSIGEQVSKEDIGEQVGVARRVLRRDFLEAGLGINGANALIAESGTVMFIENEGNARLVTSLPRVHVVLAGIEKLVPDFAAAMLQLRLLARSATAQVITSYTTFLSGPPEEGKEMHIVLVDNGRLAMREHPLIKEALRCIRCAACANVCPPYGVVGGHVFGYIYSGAIGLVNTPYHHGIDAGAGPQSLCVSCNACATVCPVGIPLPQQILEVRSQVVEKKGMPFLGRAAISLWSQPHLFDMAARAAGLLSKPFAEDGFFRVRRTGATLVPKVRALTSWRTPPAPAAEPARDKLAKRTPAPHTVPSKAEGLRVAYFIQCLTDRLFPGMAEATVKVLEAIGCEVTVPKEQHCCGLIAADAGDHTRARRMARQTIEMLESVKADYILTAGVSCAIAMLHDYEHLFEDQPTWQIRAATLTERVIDFTTFIDRVAQLQPGALADISRRSRPAVTYHSFCQSTNVLGIEDAPRRIIGEVLGLDLRELPEGTVCCGFGGSTSVVHPEVSSAILKRKLDNVATTGASVLATDNPGCIMHLRGGVDATGMPVKVMHLAELMAENLPESNT